MRLVKARLRKGRSSMGWTRYWIVDADNNLLNTEPVCTVPDGWHKWFEEHLEAMEFQYWGVNESPEESEPTVVED